MRRGARPAQRSTHSGTHSSAGASGFTLIEVLIVVVVIAILMGAVVGAFTGSNRDQKLLGYVERLTLRIEMARDRAVQSNQEWGLYVERDNVRFAEFDTVNAEWLEKTERPFTPDSDSEGLEFRVEVESYAANTGSSDDDEIPQIILFSSGEVTPFTLEVVPTEYSAPGWRLSSDGFSRTARERLESL